MERVRAKADEIRRLQQLPKLPPIAEANQPPRAILPEPVAPKTEQIMQTASDARRATTVSRWIPKPLRFFFRRHERFDRDVLRSIESLAHTNAQLAGRLAHLVACVEVQDHAIQHLSDLRRLDGAWMRAVAGIITTANERVAEIRAAVQIDIDRRLDAHRLRIESAIEGLQAFDRELQRVSAGLQGSSEQLRHVQKDIETIKVSAN